VSNVYSQKGVTPLALLALKNTYRIHVFVQSQKGVSVFKTAFKMADTTVDMELSEAEKILMNIIKQTDESKKIKMSQSCF